MRNYLLQTVTIRNSTRCKANETTVIISHQILPADADHLSRRQGSIYDRQPHRPFFHSHRCGQCHLARTFPRPFHLHLRPAIAFPDHHGITMVGWRLTAQDTTRLLRPHRHHAGIGFRSRYLPVSLLGIQARCELSAVSGDARRGQSQRIGSLYGDCPHRSHDAHLRHLQTLQTDTFLGKQAKPPTDSHVGQYTPDSGLHYRHSWRS